jgi:hypothetical protein
VKGKRLLTFLALLTDKLDGVKLSETALRDADDRCKEPEAIRRGGKPLVVVCGG